MTTQIPKFVPITDLRQGAATLLRDLRAGSEPIVIMQRSRATAVLLTVDTYERMAYEREVLCILAKGNSDIREAKEVGLDQVLADLWDIFSGEES